jgi:DNA-binding Lrp family transcriptional regulator
MDRASNGHPSQSPVGLDGFDCRLLAALQADGRLSNSALAERVGLSASQCARRRARLELDGLIVGYRAAVDPARLGLPVVAFVHVTLVRHAPDTARAFRDLVARTPAILQAYAVTGDADYLLRVAVSDLMALGTLLNESLLRHPSVKRVRSLLSLEELKDGGALPIDPPPI